MSSGTRYQDFLPKAIDQKPRLSCNRCSAQKIRCSKTRPTCAYCASKNLPCQYSLSQRTGKRSISARTQALLNDAPPANENPNPTIETGEGGAAMTLATTSSVPNTATSTEFADSMSSFLINDFGLWSPEGFNPQTEPVDIPGPSEASAAAMLPTPSHSQGNGFFQTGVPHIESYFAEPKPSIEGVAPHAQDQDCITLALGLMSSLHLPSLTCALSMSTISATHGSPGSEAWGRPRKRRNTARGMDYVLINNRATIKTLHRMLSCSCSQQDKSMALICGLIMEKMLRWYRAAMHNVDEDEDTTGQGEGLPEKVLSLPIYMGEYRLNGVSQRYMRANLVLDELKTQMKPLIEKFAKTFCSNPTSGNENHLLATCFGLEKHLRQRLRDVAKEAGDTDIV
ncbi:MAG: hypothetical protein Q9227_009026 [Pyrenula ochraceoflavens]